MTDRWSVCPEPPRRLRPVFLLPSDVDLAQKPRRLAGIWHKSRGACRTPRGKLKGRTRLLKDRRQTSTFYDEIRREFLSGRFVAGEWLKPRTLAVRFEVGLNPIGEALRRLTSESSARRWAKLCATIKAGNVSTLPDPARPCPARPSPARVHLASPASDQAGGGTQATALSDRAIGPPLERH